MTLDMNPDRFFPGEVQSNGSAGHEGSKGAQMLDCQLRFGAKCTACDSGLHLDPVGRKAAYGCYLTAKVMRGLACTDHDQESPFVNVGQAGFDFQVCVLNESRAIGVFDYTCGTRSGFLDRPLGAAELTADIAATSQAWCSGNQCVFRPEDAEKRGHRYVNALRSQSGCFKVFSQNHRKGISEEANLVERQYRLVRNYRAERLLTRYVPVCEYLDHSGNLLCLRGINGTDQSMRMKTPDDLGEKLAGQLNVSRIFEPAGDFLQGKSVPTITGHSKARGFHQKVQPVGIVHCSNGINDLKVTRTPAKISVEGSAHLVKAWVGRPVEQSTGRHCETGSTIAALENTEVGKRL